MPNDWQSEQASLVEQLDRAARELAAWAVRRQDLLVRVDALTRRRSSDRQLAAMSEQLDAIMAQQRATGEQLEAIREQVAALEEMPASAGNAGQAAHDAA